MDFFWNGEKKKVGIWGVLRDYEGKFICMFIFIGGDEDKWSWDIGY